MFPPCFHRKFYLWEMVTIKVTLYKGKLLKNNEHPIVLRIIKNRKQNKISLGISCSLKLWDEKQNLPKKNHPLFREYSILIAKKKLEAERLILNDENNNGSLYNCC
jgi:hypothetical protein